VKRAGKTQYPLTVEVSTAKQRLQLEIVRRKVVEASLKKSREHYAQLLAQSRVTQEQLRSLSHKIILAQEKERKNISRELHDEISQILTALNIRLSTLKIEAAANVGNLKKKLTTAQRLVEKSLAAVHRFARELRPPMLDDLGLVPSLLAYIKEFGKRTGLRVHLSSTTTGKIEQLDSFKRTVLYRVAQETLTNVAKNAQASLVKIAIQVENDSIGMEISDNGMSYNKNNSAGARRRERLCMLDMRERVEVTGGRFSIEFAEDKGSTVRVQIPFCKQQRRRAISFGKCSGTPLTTHKL